MWKIITITFLLISVSGCGTFDFLETAKKKTTVVTNTSVIYPSLPDIDKPLSPIQQPVVFDWPRDTSKPKVAKTTENCKQVPQVPDFDRVCLEYPLATNSNIYIGFDQQSFKNYIANQEAINGYNRSLVKRLDEVNAERAKWREENQQKDK